MDSDSKSANRPTEKEERPNISTEHQEPGDARRPRDTLDRDPPRGPAGRPVSSSEEEFETARGQPSDDVEPKTHPDRERTAPAKD